MKNWAWWCIVLCLHQERVAFSNILPSSMRKGFLFLFVNFNTSMILSLWGIWNSGRTIIITIEDKLMQFDAGWKRGEPSWSHAKSTKITNWKSGTKQSDNKVSYMSSHVLVVGKSEITIIPTPRDTHTKSCRY